MVATGSSSSGEELSSSTLNPRGKVTVTPTVSEAQIRKVLREELQRVIDSGVLNGKDGSDGSNGNDAVVEYGKLVDMVRGNPSFIEGIHTYVTSNADKFTPEVDYNSIEQFITDDPRFKGKDADPAITAKIVHQDLVKSEQFVSSVVGGIPKPKDGAPGQPGQDAKVPWGMLLGTMGPMAGLGLGGAVAGGLGMRAAKRAVKAADPSALEGITGRLTGIEGSLTNWQTDGVNRLSNLEQAISSVQSQVTTRGTATTTGEPSHVNPTGPAQGPTTVVRENTTGAIPVHTHEIRTEQQFVERPVGNEELLALTEAINKVEQYYPQSGNTIETIRNVKQQILSGRKPDRAF